MSLSAHNTKETHMPKGEQRSNKEKKKPKQQPKPAAPTAPGMMPKKQ
jgi:hypothetical protein